MGWGCYRAGTGTLSIRVHDVPVSSAPGRRLVATREISDMVDRLAADLTACIAPELICVAWPDLPNARTCRRAGYVLQRLSLRAGLQSGNPCRDLRRRQSAAPFWRAWCSSYRMCYLP
jgi:hypothetical protein